MNPETLLSGLSEAELRLAFGEAAWALVGDRWRDPDALLGDAGAGPLGAPLVWVYRSPTASLLSSPVDQDVAGVLDAWTARNRGALNLRRGKVPHLTTVNLDRVTRQQLVQLWPGLEPVMLAQAGDAAADASLVAGMDGQMQWFAPQAYEVFTSLETSAITGLPEQADDVGRDSFGMLIGAVRAGISGGLSTANGHALSEEAERQRHRSDHLALQLKQVREELDLCYLHARKCEQYIKENDASWQAEQARCQKVLRGEENLLFQLQVVQEELELQHEYLQQQLQALQRERESGACLAEENKALRIQLDMVMSELQSQASGEPPRPPGAGFWPRGRGWLRRRVLARLHPRWARSMPDEERRQALATLSASRWFDRDWYLAQNPDVSAAGLDPAAHYHDFGWAEGRDPGPGFSTRYYLETHADVAGTGMDPLLHFIRHGIKEGRLPRKP